MLKKSKRIFGAPVVLLKSSLFVMAATRDRASSLIVLPQKSLEKFGFADAGKQKLLPFVMGVIKEGAHEDSVPFAAHPFSEWMSFSPSRKGSLP
jgi:hypothetical protein